jgi:hypothetical protein
MAATTFAQLGRVFGSTWASAFGIASNNPNLDIIQIVNPSGSVLLNVDYSGAVHNPASSPTNGTNYGPYYTRRVSGTTAQLFADAFSNPSSQDILQLMDHNGATVNYIDYQGVSH